MPSIDSVLNKVVEFCSSAFTFQSLVYFLGLGVSVIIFFIPLVAVYTSFLEKRTSGVFAFFYLLSSFLGCLLLSHFFLGMVFNLDAPRMPNSKRSATSAIEKEVKASEKRLEALRETLASPDRLTIQQLHDISGKAIREAEQLKRVLVQQREEIASLQVDLAATERRAQRAIQLSSLTEPQLEAVKTLITEDATEHSRRSFILGLLASLPIGIFSSLLGASLIRAFTKETPKASS